jgi:hypothetical protein
VHKRSGRVRHDNAVSKLKKDQSHANKGTTAIVCLKAGLFGLGTLWLGPLIAIMRGFTPKYFVFALIFLIFYFFFVYFEHHAGMGALAIAAMGIVVLYGVVCIFYVFALVSSAIQKNVGRVFSVLIGLLLLLTLLPFRHSIEEVVFFAIDYYRFKFNESYYTSAVADGSIHNDPKVIFFSWGSGGFIGTNFFYALAYDESGQIAKESRSQEWKDRVSKQFRVLLHQDCSSKIKNLKGHFYSVSTLCP